MLKKIGLGMMCVLGAMNASYAEIVRHSLVPGITLEHEFHPQVENVFTNFMFWTVSAKCTINTEEDSSLLYVEVLNRKGSVNGTPLSKGQTMELWVQNGDVLFLSADSSAEVKIINKSLHVAKATCVV